MTAVLSDNETTGMTEIDYSQFDAPYGREDSGKPIAPFGTSVKDGITPLKKRGRKTTGVPTPPRSRTSKPARGATSYAEGIKGLLGIPAGICSAIAGATAKTQPETSLAFKADEATIYYGADGIATSLDAWAQVDPRVAGMLDKVIGGGPAAAFAMSAAVMVVQIAANHGAIKPVKALGVAEPKDLVAAYESEGKQNAA